jgi:hypothetical protein
MSTGSLKDLHAAEALNQMKRIPPEKKKNKRQVWYENFRDYSDKKINKWKTSFLDF